MKKLTNNLIDKYLEEEIVEDIFAIKHEEEEKNFKEYNAKIIFEESCKTIFSDYGNKKKEKLWENLKRLDYLEMGKKEIEDFLFLEKQNEQYFEEYLSHIRNPYPPNEGLDY